MLLLCVTHCEKKTDLSPYLQGIYFSSWEDKLSKYINEKTKLLYVLGNII